MKKEFENAFRKHYEKLFTLAFRLTGTVEDAEDVVQTCFLHAYRGFASFRGESSVYTWLYRILLNTARRHLRTWKKMPVTQFAEEQGLPESEVFAAINKHGSSEDEALAAMVRESCLQMFMNCMPPRYRTVFTLRVILHFSVKETAEIMEIGESAVKVYLHRARRISRDHLEGKCSLVQPGSMCECRGMAEYIKVSGKLSRLGGIDRIIRRETKAGEDYTRELNKLLGTDRLYQTRFSPGEYSHFTARLLSLKEEEKLKILGG